jgi:hypothetical protein
LRFHYRKEKFVRFSKILFQCFTSLKTCVCLKLRTMKSCVMACLCMIYNFRNNRMQKSPGPISEYGKFLPPADARLADYTVPCHIRSQCEFWGVPFPLCFVTIRCTHYITPL